MISRVLFLCIGNICRSPLAAAILREHAAGAGLNITVDSAGTSVWHMGERADARAIVAGRGHGLDISAHRARLLRLEDFTTSQLIIAMDHESYETASYRAPDGKAAELTLMRRFASVPSNADVPDPYYTGRFDPVIGIFQDCMPGLLAYLKGEQ